MSQSRIQPFQLDGPLSSLMVRHPDSQLVQDIISRSTRRDREIFVRQWLTEGEPYAFRKCPGIFEEMRGWLAVKLNVHPKEFTLVGSARVGFSLAPYKYGKPFSEESDLDLVAVSLQLFDGFYSEFHEFCHDFGSKVIEARSPREQYLWEENIVFGRRNLPKGFFDTNKLPLQRKYQLSSAVGDAMWLLCQKLAVTADAPKPKRASLRVYRDWTSLIDRVTLNLKSIPYRRAEGLPVVESATTATKQIPLDPAS